MAEITVSPYYLRSAAAPPQGMVMTPGGYRPVDKVHHVLPGHRIRRRKEEWQIVHRSSRRIASRHAALPPHQRVAGLGDGWVAYANWKNGTGMTISQIATTLTVPQAPIQGNAGQTFFLFTGLQNAAASNLLQPVLQWGVSRAGGGAYWSINNWYIDDSGHVFCSSSLQVLPGQVLTGIVQLGQESAGLCTYNIGFLGYSQLDINAVNVDPSIIAIQVLEAYRMGGRNEYPPDFSTTISSIFIAAGGAAPVLMWQTPPPSGNFGEATIIQSSANPGGAIDIVY